MAEEYSDFLSERYRGREDLIRAGFITAGAALASYAAIDSLLDGQPEVSDFWSHLAAGMASSLGAELSFHYSGMDDYTESDIPKYTVTAFAGAFGGAGIELGQIYGIPGDFNYSGFGQTAAGGISTTVAEYSQDQTEE